MSLLIWISGAVGLVLIGSLFYATQVYVANSGSTLAKYAVKTNSKCLSLKYSARQSNSSAYTECMSELEMLVKNLVSNGEINLQNCTLDTNNASIAYCPVVTWYSANTVVVTDSNSVSAITKEINVTAASDSKRRKRNIATYPQVVDQTDDGMIADQRLGKVQKEELDLQQNHLSKQTLQLAIPRPTWPTDISPIPEPPVSNYTENMDYNNEY